jgi:two-component system, NtrC family, response regulator AtoC
MARAVLIVDDELLLSKSIQRYLVRLGFDVRGAGTVAEATHAIQSFQPDIVILDYKLPDGTGLDALRAIKNSGSGAKFIFMSGEGSIDVAVQAMKNGASEFLTKPVVLEELRLLIDKVAGQERQEQSLSYFRNKQAAKGGIDAIIGQSKAIKTLISQMEALLSVETSLGTDAPPPVLITGETGTGKQLVARALHFDSARRAGPFVELNCAALPDLLVESELFGHERGAFTDAKERKTGLIEAAHGGTLFLDEIGELSPVTQAKLLKTLEDQSVRRLGSVREIPVSIRIVAATNRDLRAMTSSGTFRSDLYFRLQMLELHVPPLRDRDSDILRLADHFLMVKGGRYKRPNLSFSPEARAALTTHAWPGNVRELRNAIERAILLTKSSIIEAQALAIASAHQSSKRLELEAQTDEPSQIGLTEIERNALVAALTKSKWNVSKASRMLGISRDTLRYRVEKFDLQKSAGTNLNS